MTDRWVALTKYAGECRAYAQWRKNCGDDLGAATYNAAADEADRVVIHEKHETELDALRQETAKAISLVIREARERFDEDAEELERAEEHIARAASEIKDVERRTTEKIERSTAAVKAEQVAKSVVERTKQVVYGTEGKDKGRIIAVRIFENGICVGTKYPQYGETGRDRGRIVNVVEDVNPFVPPSRPL